MSTTESFLSLSSFDLDTEHEHEAPPARRVRPARVRREPARRQVAAEATPGAGPASDFAGLGLAEPLVRAVAAAGYEAPTPIQRDAIPHVLAGRDVLGNAQTGTGKTAAFALPILHRLLAAGEPRGRRAVRALVLAPTRELAAQIGASFTQYGGRTGLRTAVIFGGVGQRPQVDALRRGVDVLVATPGRLLDLMQQGVARLDTVETFVLDEADRMLDMGFAPDVKRVVRALPRRQQTLLFSATMPPAIRELAGSLLDRPVHVAVDRVASTCEPIAQAVYFVDGPRKLDLLLRLLDGPEIDRALVFARTKRGANRVAERLVRARVEAAAIHGNKSQSARERALAGFKSGRTRVVVATDIAARGIDVEGLSHVINYDLPVDAESYVHRVGRTGRAGRSGVALSFCSGDEHGSLAAIERLTRRRIERREVPVGLAAAPAPRPGGARRGPERSEDRGPARPRGRRPGRDGGGRARRARRGRR